MSACTTKQSMYKHPMDFTSKEGSVGGAQKPNYVRHVEQTCHRSLPGVLLLLQEASRAFDSCGAAAELRRLSSSLASSAVSLRLMRPLFMNSAQRIGAIIFVMKSAN